MMLKTTAVILPILAVLHGVAAFWRMECRGQVALGRLDPIMSPGEASQHVHTVQGSSGFSESSNYEDLMNGNCTSCAVTQDKSGYWVPALYFQHSNGNFEIVEQVGGMLAYYLQRDPNNNVTAFPQGFRMVAGDTNRRTYTVGDPTQPDPPQSEWAALNQTTQEDLSQRAIGFNCLNYNKTPEGALYRHYMPSKDYLDANCADGLRLEIAFPSCGTGAVDSPDHKSHMAYPNLVQDGWCPVGFPVRFVTLFYEVIWNTAAFVGTPGRFVLSNGDLTGFGYHGDFMMGWDEQLLKDAVNTCTNLSGEIEDCPLFNIVDDSVQGDCKADMPAALFKEDVVGSGNAQTLTALPGNVPITGPGADVEPDGSSSAAPALTYSMGVSSPSGIWPATSSQAPFVSSAPLTPSAAAESASAAPASTVPAEPSEVTLTTAADEAETTLETATSSAPITTSEAASPADPNVVYSIVTTEYRTVGNQVQVVVWKEPVVYTTEEVTTTVDTNSQEAAATPGSKHRRDHVRDHLVQYDHYS